MIELLKEIFYCCKTKKKKIVSLVLNEEVSTSVNIEKNSNKENIQKNGYENCNINDYTKKDVSCSIDNGLMNKPVKTDKSEKLDIELSIDNNQIIIPEKYIRDDEKDKIIFSKEGLFKFYEELNKDFSNWLVMYNKGNLKIVSKMGSPIISNVLLLKTTYTLDKSVFKGHKNITLSFLGKMMYDPEIRMIYDKSFKEYKIIERFNDHSYIFYSWIHSPIALASERDTKDKRMEFIFKNMYFNFSSSLDEIESENKGVVRCKTYINLLVMSSHENSVIIENFTQFDVRVNKIIKQSIVSDKLLNITLPFKTLDWYKLYIEFVNEFLNKESTNCEHLDTQKQLER